MVVITREGSESHEKSAGVQSTLSAAHGKGGRGQNHIEIVPVHQQTRRERCTGVALLCCLC